MYCIILYAGNACIVLYYMQATHVLYYIICRQRMTLPIDLVHLDPTAPHHHSSHTHTPSHSAPCIPPSPSRRNGCAPGGRPGAQAPPDSMDESCPFPCPYHFSAARPPVDPGPSGPPARGHARTDTLVCHHLSSTGRACALGLFDHFGGRAGGRRAGSRRRGC